MSMNSATVHNHSGSRQGIPGSLQRFSDDAAGSVAPVFAAMLLTMTLSIGGAIDIGRFVQARTHTKAAIDSAVLAAARSLQVDAEDQATAVATARNYYAANVKGRAPVLDDTISFEVVNGGKGMRAYGTAHIATPFLSLVQIDKLPLLDKSGADYSEARTVNSGSRRGTLEVSLMLDVTGSMAGQKIADLKAAAKDLVEILVPDGSEGTRIALAPFSDAVRPGALLGAVRGQRPSTSRFRDNEGRWHTYRLSPCVSERDGSEAYTDAAPVGIDKLGAVYTRDGTCQPGAEVVPLTASKSRLLSTINNFRAEGYTAGHLGTAWAWYLVSPEWASVLPQGSAPGSYSDPKVKKVAVLFTDGEYNLQYDAAGIATRENGGGAKNGLADAQARQVCDNMKKTGIAVFTVGFNLREAKAIETLARCASSDGQSYLADDGEALKQAFRDIALKLSPIYLSQ